jgi:lipopolysaccharide export system permease protein
MRILDRYLLREFLAYSLLGIVTFEALFVIVDLFEKLDIFVDHGTSLLTVLRYYGQGLPTTLTEILPVSLLLGALLGLSQLRKHNEVTAMQGSGQSPWRLARPLLIVALFISVAQYAMNELIGPQSYAEQRRIMSEDIKQQSDADRDSRSDIRVLGGGSRFYVASFYDAPRRTLRNLSVQFLVGRILRRRVDAESAVYRDGMWQLQNGTYRDFGDSSETSAAFARMGDSDMREGPDDFARLNQDPFHMGMKSLLTFARRVRESGGETQTHMTNFHIRASFPLADLIMVLLGTALSLRVVRGGNLALGFGISISIGFAYYALIRVGQALGYNGSLPPMLAAWLGNLIFGGLGVFLFWKVTR